MTTPSNDPSPREAPAASVAMSRLGSGAMFDGIAARYDLLNRILSFGLDQAWRRRTADALALPTGPTRVLDLATGTGDVALAVAARWPEVTVLGTDPSDGMMARGRQKIARADLAARIVLQPGDAQQIDAPDNHYDGITIAFGIRNVPDRRRALQEMARVVRPGGRICILELSEAESGILGTLARFHTRHIVPRLAALLSGAREYRYLQTSIAAFPPSREFAQMMAEAGLQVIEVRPMTFGAVHLYVATPARALEPA